MITCSLREPEVDQLLRDHPSTDFSLVVCEVQDDNTPGGFAVFKGGVCEHKHLMRRIRTSELTWLQAKQSGFKVRTEQTDLPPGEGLSR